MKAIMKAFNRAVALDSSIHRNLKVKMPENYSFMKNVEIVPLTYSEILSATMYYPVMFGLQEGVVFPFAVTGINGKNIFLKENGEWKVDTVPNVCKHYPFGVFKEVDEYTIIFDEIYASEDGQRLFDDEGNETEFFFTIKQGLTELARDFHDAEECSKELFEGGYLKPLNLEVDTKLGKMQFHNTLMANIEYLSNLQPEKLYTVNSKGYLLILHAHYLSLRNFKLFDIFAEF
ncbi:SapC family protein [Thermodesulfovibrio sp.]|uniref:SapC family protein n=1 Tax=Thermodesulfovibrio sp. TaxID=2067987 RepID=UPI003C7DA880